MRPKKVFVNENSAMVISSIEFQYILCIIKTITNFFSLFLYLDETSNIFILNYNLLYFIISKKMCASVCKFKT